MKYSCEDCAELVIKFVFADSGKECVHFEMPQMKPNKQKSKTNQTEKLYIYSFIIYCMFIFLSVI